MMLQRILRFSFAIIGLLLGSSVGSNLVRSQWLMSKMPFAMSPETEVAFYIFIIVLSGIIFYAIFPLILVAVKKISKAIESSMEGVRLIDVGLGVAGLIVGLIIAMLLSFAFGQIPIPWVSSLLTVVTYIIFGYIGFTIPVRKRDDLIDAVQIGRKEKENLDTAGKKLNARRKKSNTDMKLLDTSVVIDGRIIDICKTGFIEGVMGVPVYVLNELQLIADSSDDLKRQRGRRGLDIVGKMQNDPEITVSIIEEDYDDIAEVDAKLIRMAKDKKCKVLTNDYNLNKLATVQGIDILNINELANAVKPVVLPGEEMKVQPVKVGKENGQAIAYLDDGTMIVVENGRRHMGNTIDVVVTSILQTAAGRMIFAKKK